MAGIYVHIPFCKTKCPYCDFYSVTTLHPLEDYLRALSTEISLRSYELAGESVETVYFGGGTPSLLSGRAIGDILRLLRRSFDITEGAEITLECNPGDLTTMDLDEVITRGVSRFSIGAQTFDPSLLRFLQRRHTGEETRELVRELHRRGIRNISLDLIYGIPGSSDETLRADLDALITLEPTHISAYHLIYEEGTPLHYRLQRGKIRALEEEESLRQSHYVAEQLRSVGYEHYEISAFALPGYHSRHNSSYWHGIPYIGFGPGAHSYIHPWRSYNPSNVTLYNRQLLRHTPFLSRTYEQITPEMALEEYVLTRLRTCEGLSLSEMEHLFSPGVREKVLQRAQPYLASGDLLHEGDRIHLSLHGIDISDAIILDLI